MTEKQKGAPVREEFGLVGMIVWLFIGSGWVWITILVIGAMAIAIRSLR